MRAKVYTYIASLTFFLNVRVCIRVCACICLSLSISPSLTISAPLPDSFILSTFFTLFHYSHALHSNSRFLSPPTTPYTFLRMLAKYLRSPLLSFCYPLIVPLLFFFLFWFLNIIIGFSPSSFFFLLHQQYYTFLKNYILLIDFPSVFLFHSHIFIFPFILVQSMSHATVASSFSLSYSPRWV